MSFGHEDKFDHNLSLVHKNRVFKDVLSFVNMMQQTELGQPIELPRFQALDRVVEDASERLAGEQILRSKVHLPTGTIVGFVIDRCVDYRQLCAPEIGQYIGMSTMKEQFSPDLGGVWPLAYHEVRLERDHTAPVMPLPSEDVIVPTLFETVEIIY